MNNQLHYVTADNSMYYLPWHNASNHVQTQLSRNVLFEEIRKFEQCLNFKFQQPLHALRFWTIEWVRMSIILRDLYDDRRSREHFGQDIMDSKKKLYTELTWDSIQERLYFFDTLINSHWQTLQRFQGDDFNAMINSAQVQARKQILIQISNKFTLLANDLETFRCFINSTRRLMSEFEYDMRVLDPCAQHSYNSSVHHILEVLQNIQDIM